MKISPQSNSGFSLVEVVMALGVVSIAFVAIFGLLPLGYSAHRDAIAQTTVSNIATSLAVDLRVATSGTTDRYGIPTSASSTHYLDENGGPYPAPTALSGASQYRVTITTGTVAGSSIKYASGVISWPASVAPQNATGKVNIFIPLVNQP